MNYILHWIVVQANLIPCSVLCLILHDSHLIAAFHFCSPLIFPHISFLVVCLPSVLLSPLLWQCWLWAGQWCHTFAPVFQCYQYFHDSGCYVILQQFITIKNRFSVVHVLSMYDYYWLNPKLSWFRLFSIFPLFFVFDKFFFIVPFCWFYDDWS